MIHTDRFDESLEFYRDILELDVIEEWREGGHGAVLRVTADAELELIELNVSRGIHRGVALGLEVDDVDRWFKRLVEHGVAVKAAPVDAFGKRGFGTTDPNGVAVNIYRSHAASKR